MVAMTVPLVMRLTAWLWVRGPPVTVTVLPPPAVPLIVTSPLTKLLTASLKATVKLMGDAFVGSVCPAAWLIVTVGATASKVTVLSVLVEAVVRLPAPSGKSPEVVGGGTVQMGIPLAATVVVGGPPV